MSLFRAAQCLLNSDDGLHSCDFAHPCDVLAASGGVFEMLAAVEHADPNDRYCHRLYARLAGGQVFHVYDGAQGAPTLAALDRMDSYALVAILREGAAPQMAAPQVVAAADVDSVPFLPGILEAERAFANANAECGCCLCC